MAGHLKTHATDSLREVTKSAALTVDSQLFVSVLDTAAGLKPNELDLVFDPFQQADSSVSRNLEGTGLGLSQTRKLVELHGGRIWAKSNGEGLGAPFTFSLPNAHHKIEITESTREPKDPPAIKTLS